MGPEQPGGRKPRLLVVGPLPPPVGGVETVIQTILESPQFAGFELRHCSTAKGRPKQSQGKFDPGNLWWAARHFGRMWQAMRRDRPDVVYLPVAGTWAGFLRDMVLAWIAKLWRVKLVGHVHGSDFHLVLARRGWQEKLVRAGLARFDRLLVLGERWKRLVEDYGIRSACEIVPSTFRREVFERGAEWRRAPKAAGTVHGLFVGQIGKRKGVFDLLPAMRRVKDAGLPFRMAFVGPAELEGEWETALQMRDWLDVAGITEFTGALQADELYARYREGDVLLLPSYTEGLPVVFFEAGAFEMPVVTTPVGAIPDLIQHEKNGLLVEPGRVEQLVEAIRRMATDHEARARMGRQLRRDVEAFHPDRVCARLAAAIRATLETA